MNEQRFYSFMQKQILLLIGWSLITGLGFVMLSVYYESTEYSYPWYGVVMAISFWGYRLSSQFQYSSMTIDELDDWYIKVRLFTYTIFGLWTTLFITYSLNQTNLHYVVAMTQIGSAVMASTFLFSDKKVSFPILFILIYPLIVYFAMIEEAYGYFLAGYSVVFLALLLYTTKTNYGLIQQIYFQAQHDALTGLHNRRFIADYLEQMIGSLSNSKRYAYILLIDLDYFKTINDSLGHEMGDKLLKEVSNRISVFCGDTHLAARIGGDEFMISSSEYIDSVECAENAKAFAHKLLEILKKPYIIESHHLHLGASIGIKKIDHSSESADRVIKEADIAMYEVKSQGRNGVIDFNDKLHRKVENDLKIERKLHLAIQNRELELHYQPQMNRDKKVIGCEVLTRWNSPDMGVVSPAEFIVIAEKTGIIVDLGNYILTESFRTLKEWNEDGLDLEQFSINISVRQFLHSSFIFQVKHLCDIYLTETQRKKLVFEITETLLPEDINKIVSIMNQIKELDISVSMDDFGTGYSSLNFLREIPIDELKIDRTFVQRLGEKKSDEMMISTILSLAKIYDLRVVAEGVESREQFKFLLEQDCSIFQGYYFSHPLNKDDFEQYYKKYSRVTHDEEPLLEKVS